MINLLAVVFASLTSFADCTSPAGVAGQVSWIPAAGKVKYCNGTTWKDTTHTTGAACTSDLTGAINYSGGDLRFCNGTSWISMKGRNLGTCAAASVGTFTWDAALVKAKMCDGSNWYDLSVDCSGTPFGMILEGGSVTAYSASAPVPPATCTSQSRTCTDGVLSGTYTSTSCSNGCSGTPWGNVAHGYSGTAYSASSVVAPTTCASIAETRTCSNGVMSGSRTITSCAQVTAPTLALNVTIVDLGRGAERGTVAATPSGGGGGPYTYEWVLTPNGLVTYGGGGNTSSAWGEGECHPSYLNYQARVRDTASGLYSDWVSGSFTVGYMSGPCD